MINEHDIADFREDNHLLASFPSVTAHGPASTLVTKAYFGDESALTIHQDNQGARDFENDDDMVVLDRQAQHTLYIILKARFEEAL
jgi:hypothetical protein